MTDEVSVPFISTAENDLENTIIVGNSNITQQDGRTNSRALYAAFPWSHSHYDIIRDVKDRSVEARAYRTKMMLRAVYGTVCLIFIFLFLLF